VSLHADRYPSLRTVAGGDVRLALMTASDLDAVHAFASSLPAHDLLFLRRDITHPKVLSAWVDEINAGNIISVLAWRDDAEPAEVLGCGALVCDPLSFSPHVGEVRVLVSPEGRARGLGRLLIQECFLVALDLGLDKLTAQMTTDQQSAVSLFQEMGFTTEAVLKNQVQDRDGVRHDLVVLSQDVPRFLATMEAYGLTDR
jgi:N-acetylglutamate synthase-like GNAT family acetyltransferase